MNHGWPEHPGVRRVGLTGGIAAGKSVVSTRLGELGVPVVDHDQLARSVVAVGTPGLAAVEAAFPGTVKDGVLDRVALGAQVFADASARSRLNGIVHPLIHAAAIAAEQAYVAAGARTVVHDVPLLAETGQTSHFAPVVVVDAPAGLRVRRLVEGRGLAEDEAWARLAAQADDETRLQVADVVLDGSGDVAGLRGQVDALVASWRAADE
ncbi:dephospho-CoA kinase [Actinotalea sp. M2MS4P-6]|uniref:dephospho-CoA kinase n=1 Tax=Actinotalea sp. M2MS4P-6 TaxID=2983762 RepID=UPI0021E436C0|nr:dephospho-CoA kinase [Actinotalea sp. M2MS4P-6]MCV2394706.1 dephospho-CoA kinase [Actinotalea sp. M2MS4P-6]